MSRSRAILFIVFTLVTASLRAASLEPHLRAVETIRGRKFVHEVKHVAIDRSALPKALRQQMAESIPYSLDDWTTVIRALQLVDAKSSDEVVPKLVDLYQAQVLAYYDPHGRTYYSINQLPEAIARMEGMVEILEEGVVVHELTHALQDQYFKLGEKTQALRKDTDAGMAYHAVIEGEATLVMLAHMVSKSGASIDDVIKNEAMLNSMMAMAASQDSGIDASAPKYFVESLKFPYLQGLKLVIEAYKRGGWKAVDALHTDPPRSTREVLHPEEYFSKKFRAAKFVDAPLVKADKTLSVEHLGEFHWGFLAGANNARGWVDDRVQVAVNAKNEPTVLVETKWDSPDNANAFATAYEKFLRGRGFADARVKRTGAIVKAAYGAEKGLVESYLP